MVIRPAHRIARRTANRELGRNLKRTGVEPLFDSALVGGQVGRSDLIRTLHTESRESVEVRGLRNRKGHARLKREDSGDLPPIRKFSQHPTGVEAVATTNRNLPSRACNKDVGYVASRRVPLESRIEAVGNGKVRNRPSQDGGIENGRGGIDQLGMRVTHKVRQSVAQPLLQLRFKRVIDRAASVVAIGSDSQEAWKRLQQLTRGDRWIAQRGRPGNFAKVRIRDLRQQWRPCGQLLHRELVYVHVRNADVGNMRTCIGHFKRQITSEFVLNSEVPLLCVAGSQVAVHGENTLAEASIRRKGYGRYAGASGEHESGIDVVQGALARGL